MKVIPRQISNFQLLLCVFVRADKPDECQMGTQVTPEVGGGMIVVIIIIGAICDELLDHRNVKWTPEVCGGMTVGIIIGAISSFI